MSNLCQKQETKEEDSEMFPSDKEHWQELFRQFGSYVIVGGSGAIMEWCCFAGLLFYKAVIPLEHHHSLRDRSLL